eukprot:gene19772-26459_t
MTSPCIPCEDCDSLEELLELAKARCHVGVHASYSQICMPLYEVRVHIDGPIDGKIYCLGRRDKYWQTERRWETIREYMQYSEGHLESADGAAIIRYDRALSKENTLRLASVIMEYTNTMDPPPAYDIAKRKCDIFGAGTYNVV